MAWGDIKLTAHDVVKYADGLTEETIAGYLVGQTAPSSGPKHANFFDAVNLAVKAAPHSENIPELQTRLENFQVRLENAYSIIEEARRPRYSVPGKPLPVTDNAMIGGVLQACYRTIELFLNSADYYGTVTRAYFNEIGATEPNWEGPFTYHALEEGLDATSKYLQPPPHRRRPDNVNAMKKDLVRFEKEFAAMPELNDGLRAVLLACDKLEESLNSFWYLNRPCAVHRFWDDEQQASERYLILKAFRYLEGRSLSRDPEYVAQLHELATRADADAAEVLNLAKTTKGELDKEVIRRGVKPPPSD